jgi:thiol-disulfide isomerase/thioredoxin
LVAGSLALAACSSGGGGDLRNHLGDGFQGGGGDMAGGGSPDMAQQQAAYPQGPYGNHSGQVLADFTAAGYRLSPQQTDSTQLTWDTSISLSDYFQKAQTGECTCMLITVGATWCGACQEEQPDLISNVQSDPSFCMLGILQDGPNVGVTATQSDVDAWTQNFRENFPVVEGSTSIEQRMFAGYGQSIGLPFNLIVQPKTMTVLTDAIQGYSPDTVSQARTLCAQVQ